MNYFTFQKQVNRLFPLKINGDFAHDLNQAFEEYISLIRKVDVEDCLVNRINSICVTLQTIIEKSISGERNAAFALLTSLLDGDSNEVGLIQSIRSKKIDVGNVFFRGRKLAPDEVVDKKGLFHVSYDKREKVSGERYNYAGCPCLYLGNRVETCKNEIRAKIGARIGFVAYRSYKEFSVLDLRIPTDVDYTDNELRDTLLRIPLIITCSIAVSKKSKKFHPEYIIPQMVTEYVITKSKILTEESKNQFDPDVIWGVMYSSCCKGPSSIIDYNLALPSIVPNSVGNYCVFLASCFEISEVAYTSKGEDSEIIESMLMESKFEQLPYVYMNSPRIITFPAEGGILMYSVVANTTWEIS